MLHLYYTFFIWGRKVGNLEMLITQGTRIGRLVSSGGKEWRKIWEWKQNWQKNSNVWNPWYHESLKYYLLFLTFHFKIEILNEGPLYLWTWILLFIHSITFKLAFADPGCLKETERLYSNNDLGDCGCVQPCRYVFRTINYCWCIFCVPSQFK